MTNREHDVYCTCPVLKGDTYKVNMYHKGKHWAKATFDTHKEAALLRGTLDNWDKLVERIRHAAA